MQGDGIVAVLVGRDDLKQVLVPPADRTTLIPVTSPSERQSRAPVDEATARARATELRALADDFGVTELRFASAGRLVGHVDSQKDLLDVVGFDIAASELLGVDVQLFSDSVLTKPNVSADLVAARPL